MNSRVRPGTYLGETLGVDFVDDPGGPPKGERSRATVSPFAVVRERRTR